MIVEDLVNREGITRHNARAIASAVEEKILRMGCGQVARALIKQLVLAEAANMLRAERSLLIA
jgi:hypothetical protein